MPSYKNTSDRTILGIGPGETGDLDNADGFVGPGALEVVEESKKRVVFAPSEDAPVEPPKPDRGPLAPAE